VNVDVGEGTVALLVEAGIRLAGIALLAAVVAAATALAFRWYTRERVQTGVGVLLGLAAVAFYLNVKTAIGDVIAGETALFAPRAMAFNLGALALAALASPVGVQIGDGLATDFNTVAGVDELDNRVSDFAKAVGRVDTVTLPDEITDIEGYDPVSAATKEALAGKTLVFQRGGDLGERLRNRLKEESDVGYVDAEFEAGELTYLALGARQSGLGPTLAPGAAAVAVTADPPADASPGDTVQVWASGGEPERIATAELRAVHGDTVTLALDAADAERVGGGSYRLLTLPREQQPERAFASLLRTADETMGTVKIGEGSPLVGISVGAVDATVAALRPASGTVVPIPSRGRAIEAGDTLYVIAHPGTIRSLEEEATPRASSGQ
jgi:hypothetical protein